MRILGSRGIEVNFNQITGNNAVTFGGGAVIEANTRTLFYKSIIHHYFIYLNCLHDVSNLSFDVMIYTFADNTAYVGDFMFFPSDEDLIIRENKLQQESRDIIYCCNGANTTNPANKICSMIQNITYI